VRWDETVLANPLTGEWARLLVDPDHNGGAYTLGELLAQPGVHAQGAHRHPQQEERFEVIQGRVTFRLNDDRLVGGPGDIVAVPPGALHDWWNASVEPARLRVTVTPAGTFKEGLAAVWGLAALGRTDRTGNLGMLDAALMMEAFGRDIQMESPPVWVQRLLAHTVAPLARLAGRRVDDRRVLTAAMVPADRWPDPR